MGSPPVALPCPTTSSSIRRFDVVNLDADAKVAPWIASRHVRQCPEAKVEDDAQTEVQDLLRAPPEFVLRVIAWRRST
jgi:hypothetical protein